MYIPTSLISVIRFSGCVVFDIKNSGEYNVSCSGWSVWSLTLIPGSILLKKLLKSLYNKSDIHIVILGWPISEIFGDIVSIIEISLLIVFWLPLLSVAV